MVQIEVVHVVKSESRKLNEYFNTLCQTVHYQTSDVLLWMIHKILNIMDLTDAHPAGISDTTTFLKLK